MLARNFLPALVLFGEIPWDVWSYYAVHEPRKIDRPKVIKAAGDAVAEGFPSGFCTCIAALKKRGYWRACLAKRPAGLSRTL